jgi:hypothetical protein
MKTIISLILVFLVYVQSQATYKYYTNNSCTASTGQAAFINGACVIGSTTAIKYYCSGSTHGNINYLAPSCSGDGRNNQISSTNMCGVHSTGDIISCGKNIDSTNVVASSVSYGNFACNGTIFSAKYYYSGCYPTQGGGSTSQKYTCTNNVLTVTTYTDSACTTGGSSQNFGATCSARDFYSEKVTCGYVDVADVNSNSALRSFLSFSVSAFVLFLFL